MVAMLVVEERLAKQVGRSSGHRENGVGGIAGKGRLNVNGTGPGGKGLAVPHFSFCFMAATLKKGQLPTKICATCGLPFEYRKKWRN
nr:hypothetical protein [Tanacetum cinerariifolium]